MQWQDEGVVLGARPYGETAAIVSVFTRGHGRHLGILYGGSGRRGRALAQAGNAVSVRWRARLPEQLGHFQLELKNAWAARTFERFELLAALNSACALLEGLLPEREAHPRLYQSFAELIRAIAEDVADWAADYARFELGLLAELGFGLDLRSLAGRGRAQRVYVSPASGDIVEAPAGEEALILPAFLLVPQSVPTRAEVLAALMLTGHFLKVRAFAPHHAGLPRARARLVERLGRDIASADVIRAG
jgi:DNA repair protein RecO (recombination protein O)